MYLLIAALSRGPLTVTGTILKYVISQRLVIVTGLGYALLRC